jgi:selenocysteine lyase/cysteine desulfurase
MYQQYFTEFLAANKGQQYFTAHSHHFWPDVCKQALLDYWEDSMNLVDHKWDKILGEKVPALQTHIAQILDVDHPQQLAFAQNTHELLFRLLTCFDWQKPLRILTSNAEFYSFDRQVSRLAELPNVHVTKIDATPGRDFEQELVKVATTQTFDIIFFSHVFFNTGSPVQDLDAVLEAIAPTQAMIVVDGYHAFMALPFSWRKWQDRVFYLSGGYKYAMAGEGCCWLYCPPALAQAYRPLYTGWFAGFGQLSNSQQSLVYGNDGYRFTGSTMDYGALYRQLAVFDWLKKESITVAAIHAYVQKLQDSFWMSLQQYPNPFVNADNWLGNNRQQHGHFYSFNLPNTAITQSVYQQLKHASVHTDSRKNWLRFGFGIYQQANQFDLSSLAQLQA